MATPANVQALQAEGIGRRDLATAGANDFCLAVRADSPESAEQALDAGRRHDLHFTRAGRGARRAARSISAAGGCGTTRLPTSR
jgi:hypothetical protein